MNYLDLILLRRIHDTPHRRAQRTASRSSSSVPMGRSTRTPQLRAGGHSRPETKLKPGLLLLLACAAGQARAQLSRCGIENLLDIADGPGQCAAILTTGAASCEDDFDLGGVQQGLCNLACGFEFLEHPGVYGFADAEHWFGVPEWQQLAADIGTAVGQPGIDAAAASLALQPGLCQALIGTHPDYCRSTLNSGAPNNTLSMLSLGIGLCDFACPCQCTACAAPTYHANADHACAAELGRDYGSADPGAPAECELPPVVEIIKSSCDYPAVSVTVNAVVTTFGNEVSWHMDDGEVYGPYEDGVEDTQVFCLSEGEHVLNYIDSYGDGWHGGSIEVVGYVDPIVVEGSGAVTTFDVTPCSSVTVNVAVATFGSEITWNIDDGEVYGPYEEDGVEDTQEFCLSAGAHVVNYMDSYGDGWHGGTIEVVGYIDPITVEGSGGVAAINVVCSEVTVNVAVTTFGAEISWNMDDDAMFGPYEDNVEDTQVFCLSEGEHVLNYMDSYGDGWHGGTIEVVGLVAPIAVARVGGNASFVVCNEGSHAVSVNVVVTTFGNEVSWHMDDDDVYGPYENGAQDTQVFCLSEGEHVLNYIDSYGDGWHGGSIEVVGYVDPIAVEGAGDIANFVVGAKRPAGGTLTIDGTMDSPLDCQSFCFLNEACDVFTYEWQMTKSGGRHTCYLKAFYEQAECLESPYVLWNGACLDTSDGCAGWADLGYCDESSDHYSAMLKNCCSSCCTDSNDGCSGWADLGYCAEASEHHSFMLDNCCSSCAAQQEDAVAQVSMWNGESGPGIACVVNCASGDVADGSFCDDFDDSTTNDQCLAGVCQSISWDRTDNRRCAVFLPADSSLVTLALAETACGMQSDCGGVADAQCNGLEIGLCLGWTTVEDAGGSCVYGRPEPEEGAIDPCSNGGMTLLDGGALNLGYGTSLDCQWTLVCSSGKPPTISFTSFDTETSYDYVTIYNGNSTATSHLAILHGFALPDPVAADGNTMLVRYESDGSANGAGFQATMRCHAEWQVAEIDSSNCNLWSIHMHEDGWDGAAIRVENDEGAVLIDGLSYANDGYVVAGVADVCLGSSRCYNVSVSGPTDAHFSIHDTAGIVIVQGAAPFAQLVCPCGQRGGDECLGCEGMRAPDGGGMGTCRSDGILEHGAQCSATCAGDAVLPASCWNGVLASPEGCCTLGGGAGWDGESGSPCAECQPGRFDGDLNPGTACEPCAAGQHSAAGATECIRCAPGRHSYTDSADCLECDSGSSDSDSDPATACDQCIPGRFAADPGSVECADCPLGSYSSISATECVDCPPGYSDVDDNPATPCEACAAGKYTATNGTNGACVGCPDSTYTAGSATETAEDCVATTVRSAVDNQEGCSGWADAGFCDEGSDHYAYMVENCCESCSVTCGVASVSCVGSWSSCGNDCTQQYTSVLPGVGDGSICPMHGSVVPCFECDSVPVTFAISMDSPPTRAHAKFRLMMIPEEHRAGRSRAAVMLDTTNDGHLDIFVANDGDQRNQLLINTGSTGAGVFSSDGGGDAVTSEEDSRGCAAGDVDGDGFPDLVVANNGWSRNELLLNVPGNIFTPGTFTAAVAAGEIVTMYHDSTAIAMEDCNNDGIIDVFVTNEQQSNELHYNDGSGNFVLVRTGDAVVRRDNSQAVAISAGCAFIVVANYQQKNEYLVNDGTGRFSSAATGDIIERMGKSSGVAIGERYVFVVNYGEPNEVFVQTPHGLVAAAAGDAMRRQDHSSGAVIVDINRDGLEDVYVVNVGEPNELLVSNAAGGLDAVAETAEATDAKLSQAVAAGDVSSDNLPDIFIANSGNWENQVLISDASGAIVRMAGGDAAVRSDNSNSIVSMDVNVDGHLDLFVSNGGQNNELLINNRAGGFIATTAGDAVALPSSSRAAAAADLDGDEYPEVYVANYGEPNQLLRNDGVGGLATATVGDAVARSDRSTAVSFGTINGDDFPDVFVCNYAGPNQLMFNDGAGGLVAITTGDAVARTDRSNGAGVADLDGDGTLDVFVINWAEQNQLLLNDGTGVLVATTEGDALARADKSKSLALADVDGDFDVDIVVTNWQQANELLLNSGSGEFTATVTPYLAESLSTGCAIADINADGMPDIFFTSFNQPNEVLLQTGSGEFVQATDGTDAATSSGASRSVEVADVNGDGLLDFVVANSNQPNEVLVTRVCANGFATLSLVCYPCPPFSLGATLSDRCVFCPAGKVGPLDAHTGEGIRGWRDDEVHACIPCTPGRYRGHTEQTDVCTECPVGQYAIGGASECSHCRGAQVPNDIRGGASRCVSCPSGQQPSANNSECEDCEGATFSIVGICQECAFPNVVDDGHTTCTGCRSGQAPNAERTQCDPCEGATFSAFGVECSPCDSPNVVNEDRTTCLPCAAGQGPSNESTPTCVDCTGTTYSTIGVCQDCAAPNIVEDSFQTCRACTAGEAPNAERTSCVACEGATYSAFGVECTVCDLPSVVNDDKTTCLPCGAGQGPSLEATPTCVDCTGTTYSTTGQCQACPAGQQPNAVQTACEDCQSGSAGADGTCSECPDGTQPDSIRVTCVGCPPGTAGSGGSCGQCFAGQEADVNRTTCVDCSEGTAGVGGECGQCVDGSQPADNRQACVECPAARAGTGGMCGETCGAGAEPNTGRTTCVNCAAEDYSVDGTSCAACSAGFQPNEEQTGCEQCPVGSAGAGGTCASCAAGDRPNGERTACVACSPGTAGVGGVCEQCSDGYEPDRRRHTCVVCGTGTAGSGGECNSECVAGTQPNEQRTACEACAEGWFSSVGEICVECDDPGMHSPDRVICQTCTDGTMPNDARSGCEACPAGHAGQDGVCTQCAIGTQPNIHADTRATLSDVCVACTRHDLFNASRGWVSPTGTTCHVCPGGRAPNAENTVCDVCVPGKFSPDGLGCQYCPVGQEPNTIAFAEGATHCIVCVNGTHRHNDEIGGALDMQSCSACSAGQEPNADADDCMQCSLSGEGTYSADGAACIPCDAGSQSNADQSACEACPEGQAGLDGSCTQCGAGQTPNAGRTACVPCPTGTAGTGGTCTECEPGQQPALPGRVTCEDCPVGTAGTDGTCPINCAAGQQPNAGKTACTPCSAGEHSTAGEICTSCSADGFHTPDAISCEACGPGSEPNDARTSCEACGSGTAGTRGLCEYCSPGSAPSTDRSECSTCEQFSYSTTGDACSVCEQPSVIHSEVEGAGGTSCVRCSAGKAPNAGRTQCNACGAGRFSSFGVECQACVEPRVVEHSQTQCNACSAGQGPNSARTGCISCTGATYSTIGVCQECSAPSIVEDSYQTCRSCAAGETPNAERTQCDPCEGATFSAFGVECSPCDSPNVVNEDRTTCLPCA
eukprot:SAG22_NODE_369_length_11597_cov_4.374848_1_plen_3338_part_10